MYATAAHLQERYPDARLAEVSDPEGQAADEAKLQVALDDASAEADSYLGRRYLLPLSEVPAVLRRVVVPGSFPCGLAADLLPKDGVSDVRKRYEDAVKWLQSVVEGSQSLPDGSGVELTSRSVSMGGVRGTANDRIFDPFNLADFQQGLP